MGSGENALFSLTRAELHSSLVLKVGRVCYWFRLLLRRSVFVNHLLMMAFKLSLLSAFLEFRKKATTMCYVHIYKTFPPLIVNWCRCNFANEILFYQYCNYVII